MLVPLSTVSGLVSGFSVCIDKRYRNINIKLHFGARGGDNKEVGWIDKGCY